MPEYEYEINYGHISEESEQDLFSGGYTIKPIQPPLEPKIPPETWRCLTKKTRSGRYEGLMTAPAAGQSSLDLRVDIDPRYANSPVMNRVSGDFYNEFRRGIGRKPFKWKVYQESWVVDEPNIKWSRCQVDILKMVDNKIYVSCKIFESFMSTLGVYNDSDKVYY